MAEGAGDTRTLASKTDAEIAEVRGRAAAQREAVVSLLLSTVGDVDTSVPDIVGKHFATLQREAAAAKK